MQLILTCFLTLIFFIGAPIKNIDDRIEPYYKEFMGIVKNECPKIETPRQFIARFDTLRNEEVGLCTFYAFKRDVSIDKNFWETAPEYGRRQLVFHELTHCILNKHHVDEKDNYMNPYLNYIPEKDLITQIQENARRFCNE